MITGAHSRRGRLVRLYDRTRIGSVPYRHTEQRGGEGEHEVCRDTPSSSTPRILCGAAGGASGADGELRSAKWLRCAASAFRPPACPVAVFLPLPLRPAPLAQRVVEGPRRREKSDPSLLRPDGEFALRSCVLPLPLCRVAGECTALRLRALRPCPSRAPRPMSRHGCRSATVPLAGNSGPVGTPQREGDRGGGQRKARESDGRNTHSSTACTPGERRKQSRQISTKPLNRAVGSNLRALKNGTRRIS